jgi:hypothetical protein
MPPSQHLTLIDGFHSIHDKNSLGWLALDTKFERFALAAIATAINRRFGRIAHVEYPPRRDLVLLDTPLASRSGRHLDARSVQPKLAYEAKAGQLFDFAPQQGTDTKYLGGSLNDDLAKVPAGAGAGLFFLSEAGDPLRHLKYYGGFDAPLAIAVQVLEKNITNGTLAACETIDCGQVDGTTMKIHMCIFERRPSSTSLSPRSPA